MPGTGPFYVEKNQMFFISSQPQIIPLPPVWQENKTKQTKKSIIHRALILGAQLGIIGRN